MKGAMSGSAPAPALDDGGGPPIPPSAQVAKAEPETVEEAVTEEVEQEVVDGDGKPTGATETVSTSSDFPGDKPAPRVTSGDPGDIPEALRRYKPKVRTPAEQFLIDLEGALSGASDFTELSEAVVTVLEPQKGQVPNEIYARGEELVQEHFDRLSNEE